MPCDLPCPRALQRLVTEGQAPYSDLVSDNAGQVGGSVRIMIARHPYPFAAHHQRQQPFTIGLRQTSRTAPIMKAVPQADHRRRTIIGNHCGKLFQSSAGIIWRQHLPATRER